MPTPPISNNVTGAIFLYSELVQKLNREISRLIAAEEEHAGEDALDHALNAAFTGFHLLEWENQHNHPGNRTSARDLLSAKNNISLNLLHDIVTCTKHMTISNSAYGQAVNVRTSVSSETVTTGGGQDIVTVGGEPVTVTSTYVKFGERRAREVLNEVLQIFSNPMQN